MATLAEPVRPNVASANIQLPGVESYEQVDREIAGTLKPTAGWFALLGIAIFSAGATPGGDLVSPAVLGLSLYLLFELSIVMIRRSGR